MALSSYLLRHLLADGSAELGQDALEAVLLFLRFGVNASCSITIVRGRARILYDGEVVWRGTSLAMTLDAGAFHLL